MAFAKISACQINYSQVGTSDLTNFPVLVSGRFPFLRTVGNGGYVQNANGYDICFFADLAIGTALTWEMESYNPVTGDASFWVLLPTVYHDKLTVFFVAYGDAAIVTFQSTASAVWDADYLSMLHLPNGTVLSPLDSTSNVNNGTNHGAAAIDGHIDGAAAFDGTASYIDMGNPAAFQFTGDFTIECWFKANSVGTLQMLVNKIGSVGFIDGYGLYIDPSRGNRLVFFIGTGAQGWVAPSANPIVPGEWHYVHGYFTGNHLVLYMDGILQLDQATVGPPANNAANLNLGRMTVAPPATFFDGVLDEVRFSDMARDPGATWGGPNFRMQANPTFFCHVSTPIANILTTGSTPGLALLSGFDSAFPFAPWGAPFAPSTQFGLNTRGAFVGGLTQLAAVVPAPPVHVPPFNPSAVIGANVNTNFWGQFLTARTGSAEFIWNLAGIGDGRLALTLAAYGGGDSILAGPFTDIIFNIGSWIYLEMWSDFVAQVHDNGDGTSNVDWILKCKVWANNRLLNGAGTTFGGTEVRPGFPPAPSFSEVRLAGAGGGHSTTVDNAYVAEGNTVTSLGDMLVLPDDATALQFDCYPDLNQEVLEVLIGTATAPGNSYIRNRKAFPILGA